MDLFRALETILRDGQSPLIVIHLRGLDKGMREMYRQTLYRLSDRLFVSMSSQFLLILPSRPNVRSGSPFRCGIIPKLRCGIIPKQALGQIGQMKICMHVAFVQMQTQENKLTIVWIPKCTWRNGFDYACTLKQQQSVMIYILAAGA